MSQAQLTIAAVNELLCRKSSGESLLAVLLHEQHYNVTLKAELFVLACLFYTPMSDLSLVCKTSCQPLYRWDTVLDTSVAVEHRWY